MHKLVIPLLLVNTLNAASFENKLELGTKTTLYNYTERDSEDQILDTEKSDLFNIGGIYGSYDHKIGKSSNMGRDVAYYMNIYASVEYGSTDYVGSILDSNQGYGSYTSTTENSFYEIQTNLKRVKSYDSNTGYVLLGLGYKEWERRLSKVQIENYNYFFAQAATGGNTAIYNDWSLGLDLTAQLAINPRMEANFYTTTQTLDETFNLGTTYTYKVAVPFTIPIDEQLNFSIKVEYEFTSIGKSNTIITPNFIPCSATGCYEPDSQQKNLHAYAGFQLIF